MTIWMRRLVLRLTLHSLPKRSDVRQTTLHKRLSLRRWSPLFRIAIQKSRSRTIQGSISTVGLPQSDWMERITAELIIKHLLSFWLIIYKLINQDGKTSFPFSSYNLVNQILAFSGILFSVVQDNSMRATMAADSRISPQMWAEETLILLTSFSAAIRATALPSLENQRSIEATRVSTSSMTPAPF